MAEPQISHQAIDLLALQADMCLKHGIDFYSRTIQLIGPITDKTFKQVDAALSILERQSGAAITIRISSLGGECYAALAIVSRMRSSKCKVHTEAHGSIMSAATLILAAGRKRSMSSFATFMFHEAAYNVGGRHSEVQAWVEQFEREEQTWSKIMEKLTGTEASYWATLGKHTDKFFTPEALLEKGVIDKVF